MRVKEWQNEVVFLHEVAPGAADRSYGIHVAQLAGLPAAVVARAEEVLAALEKGEQSGAVTRLADDLPLFAAAPARPAAVSPSSRNRKSRRRSATSIPTSSRRARRWSCSTACASGSSLSGARTSRSAHDIMMRTWRSALQSYTLRVRSRRPGNGRSSGSGCCQSVSVRKTVARP